MKPGLKGPARWLKAFQYSAQGLTAAYKNEAAFREELWISLIAIPMAFWLGDSGVEIALLIGSVLLMMVVELLNSAIEAVVDRVGSEHHELAGRAKDMGSAAVLIMGIIVLITWLAILLPK